MPSGSIVSAGEALLNNFDINGAFASLVPITFSAFGFNDSPNSYADPSYLFNFDLNAILPQLGLPTTALAGSATYYEIWLLDNSRAPI